MCVGGWGGGGGISREYTNRALDINASVTEYDPEIFCGALYFILT
jgi:hypothetical protein